ncbi:MAG: hypothetical protein NVS2B16_07250 [Chloroflexota bacterium]
MEPRSTDFLSHECSVHIDAPIERVFAIAHDLGRSAEWAGSGHIRSIKRVNTGPIGTGARYRSDEKIVMPYHADTEIVAHEAPSLIVWISKPAGERVPHHRWSFRLAPDRGGTTITHVVRAARAPGLMGWVQRLGFLFTRPHASIRPGMERTLANIKELAERPEQSSEGERP